ncbi:MAG: endolytic transglycosylase MltG [Solirubrobacteraceae bacterium]|nr:endolytic transglycosylase MltG [Solirubrobacteraceae bacterium]
MSRFGRQQGGGERSAADRERARLEREARRAEREGRPVPELSGDPAPAEEPLPPEAEHPVPAPVDPGPPQGDPFTPDPVPVEPAHEPLPVPEDPAPPQGDPFVPEPEAPPVPEPEDWLDADEPEVRRIQPNPPAPPPAPAGTLPAEPEAAIGATKAPRGPRGPRGRGKRPIASPPGDAPRGVRRARRWRRPVAIGALLLVLFGMLWVVNALVQPFGGEGEGRVVVRIPEGASARDVGDLLDEKGVVDSGAIFSLRTLISGKRDDLRSGRHVLARNMSYGAAIEALTTVPKAAPAPTVVKFPIPEGLSRSEIAARTRKAGIEGSYLEATKKAPAGFSPRKYGAPKNPRSLEGFLFPATYDLRPSQTVRGLVRKQLDTFETNIRTVNMKRARARNLTRYDVLIIASMIDREAQLAKERRQISAVIHNRLREGMPLGIDATTRYATNNWTRPLRQSELTANSAYNTRTNTGLPPTPIGNPGLASIKAAANPAASKVLYYVVKPGTCGEHAFSSTEAQFQRDVQRYNDARTKAGGKSPTTC